MFFSEYVVTERNSSFLDPLAFMRPAGILGDQLFEQFTVLSNSPVYHGVLCVILDFITSRERRGGAPLGREFRRAEILWGVLNAMRKTVVINIRKYARLLEDRQTLRLRDIPATHSLFSRLGYGTLGHYTQPSISWGLLEPDGKRLTSAGQQLAQAAAVRDGVDLRDWLSLWMDGKEIAFEDLQTVADRFAVGTPPDSDERKVWVNLIDAWTERHPTTRALWKDPLQRAQLEAAESDAIYRANFLSSLPDRYPGLAQPLRAIGDFEALSGFVQFFFDLHLTRLQFTDAGFVDLPHGTKQALVQAGVARARDSMLATETRLDPGGLFAKLAESSAQIEEVERLVLNHHVVHQRGKGVSPFCQGNQLLVRDKVDRAELGNTLELLAGAQGPQESIRLLAYRSRRDWHFGRCRRYWDYAFAKGSQ